MNGADILQLVEGLGLRIVVNGADMAIRGPRHLVTPALLDTLKEHKAALRDLLRPREFLWHGGYRDTQTPDDPRAPMDDWAPVGAWWWRWQGETTWQSVPGRGGEHCSLLPSWLATLESRQVPA